MDRETQKLDKVVAGRHGRIWAIIIMLVITALAALIVYICREGGGPAAHYVPGMLPPPRPG